MPRRRVVDDARRKYEPTERESECGAEDDARRVLPRLVRATPPHQAHEPMQKRSFLSVPTKPQKRRTKPTKSKTNSHALSLLDEQMLVLCRSAIQHSWATDAPEPRVIQMQQNPVGELHNVYGFESIYAAIQVQKVFRGFKTRKQLAQIDGLRFQRAAGHIQYALRRILLARRCFKRWMGKRHRCATRIQAWYRGCRCRDVIEEDRLRMLVAGITMFQRRFRGYRFWNLVAMLLAQRRNIAATQIQRCYRGMAGRLHVQRLRHNRMRFAMELRYLCGVHRRQPRCKNCHPDSWTEESLFGCFMVRFIGLHDLHGAKTLGLEGMQAFPQSARFSFMYSILLQAMGDDLDICLAFHRRAEATLGFKDSDLQEIEYQYLFPALQLSKNDIAVLVDLAIVSQCTGKLTRASSFYRLALEQSPSDYSVPGYLHRVDMLDRLLLNYHRFCSIFNSRQVNVLVKVIPIAKRGANVRVMVTRHNHFVQIQCAGDEDTSRFNAIYLSDVEVSQFLSHKDVNDEDDEVSPKPLTQSHGIPSSRKGSARHSSSRRIAKISREGKQPFKKSVEIDTRRHVLKQIFQSDFRGLIVKPTVLSGLSETRSKLQFTRDHAERLLRELVFIDPQAELKAELSDFEGAKSSGSAASLHRVLIVPSILKQRMLRLEEVLCSHAIVNIQRIFRGFRVRSRMRREVLFRSIRQSQADQLYFRLQQNYLFREKRRSAATAIQRIFKGYATRVLMTLWKSAATTIERIFRGYRGRKRAIAFREGNLTFYMAERVFQRGTRISDKAVILIIDRCGLSFRLEAYDMMGCIVYPGFVSHESTMSLLRYENWSYAQSFIGRDVWFHGTCGAIQKIAYINHTDGQCVMECRFDGQLPGSQLVKLADCIQAINMRNVGLHGLDTEQLQLPLTVDATSRIVLCIVQRLALVPAIPMATKELRKKSPGGLILTAMPPPKVHYIFNKTDTVVIERSGGKPRVLAELPVTFTRQIAFPVVDGYRGVSIGKRNFRQKCLRHSIQFTKCRCVLPLTTTPAHVQAIILALTPPPPPSYQITQAVNRPSSADAHY